ncbi:MAG: hypothetical protein K2J71_09850 [Oscillospiraceae bacterium]|nr:hypothetical protein [Oscillospiraceae bacterium]
MKFMKEEKNTFSVFVGILLFFVMCLANILPAFADDSVDETSNKNVTMIASFDSAYEYTKSLFEEHSDAFYRMKDWILSEDCQAYYRVGPYPEEVRKSLYWAETRNLWEERAELYQSEPIYNDFDMLFTTYHICDIVALNDGTDGNLYGNPPTWVSFWILSEQYSIIKY